ELRTVSGGRPRSHAESGSLAHPLVAVRSPHSSSIAEEEVLFGLHTTFRPKTMRFSGRQTQFYIDIIYGLAFSLGFGYLLFAGMDPRVAAFQGGLVLGYFLRVWENMSVYERILEEEVAAEAEGAVAEELETQVPEEAEDAVAEELEAQVEPEVTSEVEAQVPEEVASEVEECVPEEVASEVEEQVSEEVTTEVRERVDDRIEEEIKETVDELIRAETGSSVDDLGSADTDGQ
ncbi:MAG: hypothetical protein V5A36_08975, partial [Natronomonas sp.]